MIINNMNNKSMQMNDIQFVDAIKAIEQKRLVDPRFLDELTKPYLIRAVDYRRVSTVEQASINKVSIPEQKISNAELIQRNKWAHHASYSDEGKSGKSIEKRPGFMQMIEDAKLGKFDVIVAWTTDRLARNLDEMTALRSELKKYNVQITTVKEPVEVIDPRKFAFQQNDVAKKILAFFFDLNAEQDNLKRVMRFESGKLGKARKGKIPVKVPYGYKKIVKYIDDDPKKKYEEDIVIEERALVVRKIFDLYDKNSWGMRKIVEELNFKNIPSSTGSKWCYSSVKYTLQNPTYTGLVRFGWRLSKSKESRARLQQGHEGLIVKGQHKRIIEPEQFKRVQEKMAIRKILGGRAVSSKGLLTGILKCGRCGGGAYLSQWPNWLAYTKADPERSKHKKVAVYLCGTYAHYGKSGCTKRRIIAAQKIESFVINKIEHLANSQSARQEFVKQMKKNNVSEIKTKILGIDQALLKLEERRARIKIAFENNVIQLEEFTKDRKRFDEEYFHLTDEKERTSLELINEEKVAGQSDMALYALADFSKSWERAEFAERKQLLQLLLEKITVKDEKIDIFFKKQA